MFQQTPQQTKFAQTKHRRVATPLPSTETLDYLANCALYEPSSMNDQIPLAWDRAIDYNVYDHAGNKFIDFTSCIFVANVGHSNPKVVKAIQDTVNKGLLNSYYYPTKERSQFSKLLCETTGYKKVLYYSTGSEAVESAIKMAMMKTGKNRVLSFIDSFHGKTTGSQAAGGKFSGQKWMASGMKEHVIHLSFPNKSELKHKSIKEIREKFIRDFEGLDKIPFSCVITEPYQGFSADFMEPRYAKCLREWCTKNGVYLIVDEIQSGFGRTGKFFAYEHWNIRPDIVVCGKAISSSLPVSCVLMDFDTPDKSFNSTHGSNPVGLAASKASLEYLIDNDLVNQSHIKGKKMKAFIEKWQKEYPKNIKKINCTGLLCGFYIEKEGNSKEENVELVNRIIEEAFRRGVLSVYTNSGTIKIGCPLTIPTDALLEGLQVLKDSFIKCIDIQEL